MTSSASIFPSFALLLTIVYRGHCLRIDLFTLFTRSLMSIASRPHTRRTGVLHHVLLTRHFPQIVVLLHIFILTERGVVGAICMPPLSCRDLSRAEWFVPVPGLFVVHFTMPVSAKLGIYCGIRPIYVIIYNCWSRYDVSGVCRYITVGRANCCYPNVTHSFSSTSSSWLNATCKCRPYRSQFELIRVDVCGDYCIQDYSARKMTVGWILDTAQYSLRSICYG